ncbi:recombinase family protein [Pseudalkalibacillus hwajinpoensis]|uniref:recombinase family protein n=1 Tax=Guptibacillus hwajinpoensis TaxID=208199 RepID=UPI00325A7EB1
MIAEEYQKRIAEGGVLIYLRKSRQDTEDALANHRMILEGLCKKHGWSYVIKEEIGSSDSIEHRKEFNEILNEDIPSNNYSAIVVYDQDRLSRNTVDIERIKEKLTFHDVLLVDKDENVTDFDNDTDVMVSDWKSFMGTQEFKIIKRRLKEGKKAGALKGNWVNGKAPYGYVYSYKSKKLEPDTEGNPSPSEVIKSIFHDAYEGVSTSDIAFKLNRKGILSPSGIHWNNTTINRMLKQGIYLGKTIYGKSSGSGHKNKKTTPLKVKEKSEWIVVNNAHEPLVAQEIFDNVQDQLNRRNKVIATRKSKVSSLSGLIRCSSCGAGLYIQRKDSGSNIIKSCWRKDPFGNKCGNKGMAETKVIDAILTEIKKYRDDVAEILDKGQGENNHRTTLLKDIDSLEKELKGISSKFERIADLLEDEVYTKEVYLIRKDKLIQKQKDVENDLIIKQNQLKKQDAVEDKDKLALLDMLLTNFDKIVEEKDINKLFKSIISHVDLKKESTNDKGKVTVNFS